MERFLCPPATVKTVREPEKQTQKRQRKYDKSFLQYGFTSVTESNEGRPKCLQCANVLSAESMKPNKLKRHFETTHKEHVGKPRTFFEKKYAESSTQRVYFKKAVMVNERPLKASFEMELSRPELFDFHGVSMIHFFTENWDEVQNFKARPGDIVIATYPKAGTTWVSQIVDLLYFGKSDPDREASIPIYERVPFLEMSIPNVLMGAEMAEKMTSVPRIIKTHFPVQFVPKSFWEENCKIIYVARNAKDNVVSYFHFDRMNMVQPEPGDWPSYLQRFQEGKVVFGSWYDHVKGWWEKKQTYGNIHYMFYEDLIEDTAQEIEKICSFLNISPTQEEKDRVRREVGFDAMKKNEMANYSTLGVFDFKISPFMRKGKVSDWKNHFTVAQNEQFDEVYQKKMANTTLRFRTEI